MRIEDAQLTLNNLEKIFPIVKEKINNQILSLNPNDKETAQRIVITLQVMESLKRELYQVIQNGEIEAFNAEFVKKGHKVEFIR